MLIKVFTSCFYGWDSLNPPLDETDFTVNLYRLLRGYTAETDSRGASVQEVKFASDPQYVPVSTYNADLIIEKLARSGHSNLAKFITTQED